MAVDSLDALGWLRKHLEQDDPDLLREMVKSFAEQLMSVEADAVCGAGFGERSPERLNSRNGYRDRDFDTRAGTIDLAVPKLREGRHAILVGGIFGGLNANNNWQPSWWHGTLLCSGQFVWSGFLLRNEMVKFLQRQPQNPARALGTFLYAPGAVGILGGIIGLVVVGLGQAITT